MSEEQKMIMLATTNMGKKQLQEILSFIEYIQFKSENVEAPKELIPNNKEDLEKMLEEADKDIENGDVYSFDEVATEIRQMFAKWGA